MEDWTLVYRVYVASLSSRQRHTEWVRDELMAYYVVQSILKEIDWQVRGGKVSIAYVIRPDGAKIPLLSAVPPHPLIPREQVLETLTHRPRFPAPQKRLPIDREVFRRRLQHLHLQFPMPGDAGSVLGHLVVALVVGNEQGLATLCQEILGPLSAPPRTCAANRERLLRRLRGFATHAQGDFPAIALVLTYLAHAFAEGTESRVWAVCEMFRKRELAKHQQTEAGAVSSHA